MRVLRGCFMREPFYIYNAWVPYIFPPPFTEIELSLSRESCP